jgi:F0F1-type ATP synthase delta subunit
MEDAYAQALWQIIEKGTPQADAVRALHAYLKKSGREALLPRIAKAFERLAAGMNDRQAVTLTVADKSHEHAALKSAAPALSRLNLDDKSVNVRIDPTLIGGWRLEGREALIDESYKKHLLAIYTAATQ